MTKPWEERWYTHMRGSGVELLREDVADDDEDLALIARSFEQSSGDMQLTRMELAAAAPELYRALAALVEMAGDRPSVRWKDAVSALRKARGE